VKILEASSESLRLGGAPVDFSKQPANGWRQHPATAVARSAQIEPPKLLPPGTATVKKPSPRSDRKGQIKIVLNGNGH
jgi:hypothetical protein